MKWDFFVSGVILLVLGIIINSSVNNGAPFNVHNMCSDYSFLQPCDEKISLLHTFSLGLLLFGLIVAVYGLVVPSKRTLTQEVVVKERIEREREEPRRTEEKVFVRCPYCGKLNEPEAKFCKWCGKQIYPAKEIEEEEEESGDEGELGEEDDNSPEEDGEER